MSKIEDDVQEIKGDIREIKQVLKGYDGQTGLCQVVERHTKEINKLWIVLLVLVATLGGGGYGIVKLLLK